jgi:hypothetical protein
MMFYDWHVEYAFRIIELVLCVTGLITAGGPDDIGGSAADAGPLDAEAGPA